MFTETASESANVARNILRTLFSSLVFATVPLVLFIFLVICVLRRISGGCDSLFL